DDALDHIAGLDIPTRHGLLHARHNDIAKPRIAAPGPAEHLDTHALFGARVVSHIEIRIHLNHTRPSFPTRLQPASRGRHPRKKTPCRLRVTRRAGSRYPWHSATGAVG